MSFRNLSPQNMFQQMAAGHVPEFRFSGSGPDDFRAWKEEALPRVLDTLGDRPERVPPNPELLVEWEHDGLRKQRWLIDVGPHIAATCRVNVPGDLPEGERRPAILCCHGHGQFGKETIMGNDSSAEKRDSVKAHNSNYGHQMARMGFVTYAIDWIGFGERNDGQKPNHLSTAGARDWCNLYYLHATMLGMTSLSINTTHGMAATDFAADLPCVDADRLGVMGLSGGGTMALWMALCDERFRATEVICYSDLWAHFGFRDINYCGMQVAPGLYKLVDLPDLQGLLAPRPLLVDIGVHDTCFVVDTAMACYRQVKAIYEAAGAADRLELDLHGGEHAWGGNRSEGFFRRHLGAGW
ncbi:MAG: alpha/beta hydrolase family protein [Candidatus Brocadiia bacterium]